ncbi:DUF6192 family protein [[Kitasatospora] papulosa]|uniref:DUF6192 family protein n=1 Tax=[Kitasatospora] papulosa TaxID=1464011 RepID=UPI0036A714E4
MPEEIEKTDEKVGSVTGNRYEQIVAELLKVVEAQSKGQFTIGDRALEIEPIREYGGQEKSEGLFTVKESLFRLAEDIGLSYKTLSNLRWTAAKWPKDRRQAGVSWTIHRILGRIEDEEERFAAILTPPENTSRWTPDEAKRRVGWQVAKPVTPQEKVSAIHSLARDEEVAAAVAGDFLRRPTVIAQVKEEDRVRAVEELTRDDKVAAAVTPEFLRRPAVVSQVTQADKVRVVEAPPVSVISSLITTAAAMAVTRLDIVPDQSPPDLASEDSRAGAGRTAAGTGRVRFPLVRWVLAPRTTWQARRLAADCGEGIDARTAWSMARLARPRTSAVTPWPTWTANGALRAECLCLNFGRGW